MPIDIQTRGFTLTDSMEQFIQRHVDHMRGRRHENISTFELHLSDINGPRGGADKRCRLLIRPRGAADVIIEDTQPNMYSAIDRAFKRGGQSLSRKLTKQRIQSRRPHLNTTKQAPADLALETS